MSTDDPRDAQLDAEVRAALDRSDPRAAATLAFEVYGKDILSFLIARLRSPTDGQEVFSMFAEDLWKGLPSFAFRCSVRGFMYAVARNAANRYAASPQRRRARNVTLSGEPALAELIERTRSATALHMRTDVKSRMRELRERLELEDQTLLLLHVDRGLSFRELAVVMSDEAGSTALEGESLEREAARLRKRFERVKAELRRLAVQEGLVKR